MAITIKDVAKRAGVSTATVSKVINNVSTISEPTANKVRAVMKEMDYTPNRSAQNFARRSTRTVVFVAELSKNFAFKNPHVFEIMVGLQNALMAKNYLVNVVSVTKENYLDVLKQMIVGKSIDGIVVHISVVSKELEKIILDEEFPHIVIGAPEYKSHLCWIDNNNVLSGELAAKYLLERQYKTIAYIGGSATDIGSTCRLNGVQNILKQKKKPVDDEYFLLSESTIQDGSKMTEKLLSLDKRPDAIVCANNYLALGALNTLHKEGIDIPNEMGLITFDVYPFAKITDPHLTTIDIDVYDLGKQAGEIILRKIRKPNLQIQSYTTLANLIESESTK